MMTLQPPPKTTICASAALACALLASVAAPSPVCAQMFAHRIMVPVPLDDTTRQNGLLPGFTYFGDMQRSWHTAGDDRAWDARLAAAIELWRFNRKTSIVITASDELVANSLNSGGFHPRGISWELSAGVARQFGDLVAQLDFAHYCRHAIDDAYPPGPAYSDASFVPYQRDASMNAPRLRVTTPRIDLGAHGHLRVAVTGERFQDHFDGRLSGTNAQTVTAAPTDSWRQALGAGSVALRFDRDVVGKSSIFVRASGISMYFRGEAGYPVSSRLHDNGRLEVGWRAMGGAGAMELYAAGESLFDDLMLVTPRTSRILGIGIRLAERNQF